MGTISKKAFVLDEREKRILRVAVGEQKRRWERQTVRRRVTDPKHRTPAIPVIEPYDMSERQADEFKREAAEIARAKRWHPNGW